MGLVIPSSENKRYLSGIDWVMGILDSILKEKTCAGNISQIVFRFDSRIGEKDFQNGLTQFLRLFPVLQGRVSRDYNLAPYWKTPKRIDDNGLSFLKVHHQDKIPTDDDLISLIGECVNQPFNRENDHLAFHLIYPRNLPSYLVVTFDHRLFDARGAELFVDLLQQYLAKDNDSGLTENISLAASADLAFWKDKFAAGKQLNRKIISLSQTSVRGLPLPDLNTRKGFKFKIISFDQPQTEKIYDRANKEAGVLMEMPYLLATVLQTVHELFEKRNISAASYLIPASIDKRPGKDIKKEIFFNYTSFLFFQIEADSLNDKKKVIEIIKEQMYEQVQSGLPENIGKASALLRIAPFSVLKRVFKIPFDGKIASFCFSHVGKSSYQSVELMNRKIVNIFHMPRVPVPPGFGIFFNSFNGRLNATISWLDGLLSDEEASFLEKSLANKLTICQ